MTENEMVGWHHRLNGHEFGWTLGVGDGQGDLAYCGSWGCKELDMTEQLNWQTGHLAGVHASYILKRRGVLKAAGPLPAALTPHTWPSRCPSDSLPPPWLFFSAGFGSQPWTLPEPTWGFSSEKT